MKEIYDETTVEITQSSRFSVLFMPFLCLQSSNLFIFFLLCFFFSSRLNRTEYKINVIKHNENKQFLSEEGSNSRLSRFRNISFFFFKNQHGLCTNVTMIIFIIQSQIGAVTLQKKKFSDCVWVLLLTNFLFILMRRAEHFRVLLSAYWMTSIGSHPELIKNPTNFDEQLALLEPH